MLLSMAIGACCGETNSPINPGVDPQNDTTPGTEPDSTAPHPATFSDYIQLAPASNPTTTPANAALKPVYPVVENKVSSVANQLVRDSSNEGLFLAGGAPLPIASGTPALGDAVPLLHSGPFTFHTQLTVENFLNDNYLGVTGIPGSLTSRRGSWLQNATPSFSMAYAPNERTDITAFYSFTYHDYTTNVERDYYDESGGVSIKLKHIGVDGLSFSISELYNQVGNTIVNPLANQFDINNLEIQTNTRYATNSLPVSFAYLRRAAETRDFLYLRHDRLFQPEIQRKRFPAAHVGLARLVGHYAGTLHGLRRIDVSLHALPERRNQGFRFREFLHGRARRVRKSCVSGENRLQHTR